MHGGDIGEHPWPLHGCDVKMECDAGNKKGVDEVFALPNVPDIQWLGGQVQKVQISRGEPSLVKTGKGKARQGGNSYAKIEVPEATSERFLCMQ